jgi:putative transposase
LVGLPRASYYYRAVAVSADDLAVMREMDAIYTAWPFYGSRRLVIELDRRGYSVNRKRIQRLRRLMGLETLYPKPQVSAQHPQHRVYPYLLRGVAITRVHQVWGTDITYIPMARGFMYLVAILEWYSRYVLAWKLSNTLDTAFCLEALEEALAEGKPEIFNSDQGAQFTSMDFTGRLEQAQVHISMDGRGRALDNVFTERLWRTVKYEDIYLKEYPTGAELVKGLAAYFTFYNHQRPHQNLGYRTPAEVYRAGIMGSSLT